jgi:hypothetical protein
MSDLPYAPISLGRWDPYRRTPSISLVNGRIKFLPGPGTQGEFEVKEAAFPVGARLEYRVRKGDMYFDGDHSQALGRTLWVIEPNGSRILLADGFILYISLTVAAKNLEKTGIPFRAVNFYEGKDGKVIETELSIPKSGRRLATGLFLGFSNVWLGVIAGLFIRNVSYVVGLGVFGFSILAIATLRSATSKRVAALTLAWTSITYSAGYAVVVLLTRWVVSGLTGRQLL